jgi:MFS family permease
MAVSDNGVDDGRGQELREESIGALLKQLSEQTSTLVKQELDLAKAELTERGKRGGVGAGLLGGGGLVALYAIGALTAAVIAALATGMHTWLAALIVAVVYGVVAGVLAITGKKRVTQAVPPAPNTVESIKEDVQWAKTQKPSSSR